jgi:acyl-CoA synthetase
MTSDAISAHAQHAVPQVLTTLAQVVRRNAIEQPDAPAIIEGDSGAAMSWREYDERSGLVAAALVARGHARGARIGIQISDGPMVHAVMLGLEKAGLVGVGIGPRAGTQEVEHLMGRTGAVALLRDGDVEPLLVEGAAAPTPVAEVDRAIADHELWFLNSTSGTTGLPKCVMHQQSRWFAFHRFAMRASPFTRDDVFCSALPAPFGFGLWTGHFTPAIVGAPCIVLERFTPEGCIRALERYRVSVLAAVSTQFIMMLNSPALDGADLAPLRVMYTGGEMIPPDRAAEWEDRTGSVVLNFYGSNETGVLSGTSIDTDRETRLRTAGVVIPEMHVRLFDDAGRDVTATGGPAIPAAKGPTLCLGYYDDPEANAKLYTADGWMLMADYATLDERGVLTVVGRSSDIIIRGGKNISAPKVEEEIATHPAVALVAAVAMPDAIFGERVCAYVVLRAGVAGAGETGAVGGLTLAELNAHLAERGVGKEYWPERLEIIAGDLPRSSGGKVAKGQLRDDIRSKLAAEA